MKYASDQREITSLIIDWSNLPYGYDDYTVDKIHDFAVRKHTAKYGATAINNNPTGFGLQTFLCTSKWNCKKSCTCKTL